MNSIINDKKPFVSMHIKSDGTNKMINRNMKIFNQKSSTVLSLLHDSFEINLSSTSDEIAMNINGIVIEEDDDQYKIYTDPFGSIPLFYCKHNNGIFISSDIRSCLELVYDGNIDLTGFWELIKFGICLGTRTLYQKVKQIPGASYLTVKKRTSEKSISGYWDYYVPANSDLSSMTDTIGHLDALINKTIERKISKSNYENYVMGISGGLDSRSSLNYFSQHISTEQIKLFTFGANEKTLEYQYAKQLTAQCNISPPVFIKLNDHAYTESLNDLSTHTAGHINLMHGHISYCLNHYFNKVNNACQLSNYWSDAIFGYSCINPSEDFKVGFKKMSNDIQADKNIPKEIRYNIIEDLTMVFKRCCGNAKVHNNYSSFFEYFYSTEKNVKFHSNLLYNQSSIVPALALYTDIDLFKFMLSVPIKYRKGKYILAQLIDTVSIFKGKGIGDISSRDFNHATNKLDWSNFDGFKFKSINRLNIIFDILTSGKFRLNNKQLTEDIQGVYHRLFRKKIKQAKPFLIKRNILNVDSISNRFRQIRLRPKDIGENMQLLSIVEGVHSLKYILER